MIYAGSKAALIEAARVMGVCAGIAVSFAHQVWLRHLADQLNPRFDVR